MVVHEMHVSAPTSEMQTLDNTMKSLWEMESFGISSTDCSHYDELRDTIVFRNGRYEVQLHWKMPHQDLPNNYDLSRKRLYRLLCRLKHGPDVLQEYETVIKTQLKQGIVELVEVSCDQVVYKENLHHFKTNHQLKSHEASSGLRHVGKE